MPDLPPHERLAALRILDANLNRAAEGLRTVEEYARFVLDDGFLSGQLKNLRHQLTETLAMIDRRDLLLSRETLTDVGTSVTTVAEYDRANLAGVVSANLQRVQQALRAMEEYGKVLGGEFSVSIESIRYEVYTLERAVVITAAARQRLADARLYVLLDAGDSVENFANLAEKLVRSGVDLLQLREKTLDDRTLLDRAKRLRQLTRGSACRFIMNDRPDLAVLAHADGVQVGQEELSVYDVRRIVGPEMLIGVSTHNIEQARQAVLDGADYLGCGPTFPSTTKPFESLAGLDFLRQVAAEISLPAFAIGGIDLRNLDQVLETGFTRVAVSGAVSKATDPVAVVSELSKKLARSGRSCP